MALSKTLLQYDEQVAICRELFEQKTRDYGTAWRILRVASLTDQLYIKAWRIRTIQVTGQNVVGESIGDEFVGIVNYGVMSLVQLGAPADLPLQLSTEQALTLYDTEIAAIRDLMLRKNRDYGEVWRQMRLGSITDLILQKLLRIKQIEDNQGATRVSEGAASGYRDIVNYAIFARILLNEGKC